MVRRAFLASLASAVLAGSQAFGAVVSAYSGYASYGSAPTTAVNVGNRFVTNSALSVTALGVFDPFGNKQNGNFLVAVYADNGTTLATATVGGTGVYTADGSQFVTLATPLLLPANTAFRIDAYYPANTLFTVQAPVTVDPNVTFTTAYYDPYSTSGPLFPTYNPGTPVYAGPNFQFNAVPEPAGLVAVGGVLVALLRRRRV